MPIAIKEKAIVMPATSPRSRFYITALCKLAGSIHDLHPYPARSPLPPKRKGMIFFFNCLKKRLLIDRFCCKIPHILYAYGKSKKARKTMLPSNKAHHWQHHNISNVLSYHGKPLDGVIVRNNPINRIDPSGLLAFPWHFGITYMAARDSGRGVGDSLKLAWDTMAVDFGTQGTTAAETVQHAMAFPGQSQSEAIAATTAYIQSSINSNISGALHAAQDLATPEHQGKEWSGFLSWKTPGHILGDVFPSWSTIKGAYQNSTAIMNSKGCSK